MAELAVRVTLGLEQVSDAVEGVDTTATGAAIFWVMVMDAVEAHPPVPLDTVRV